MLLKVIKKAVFHFNANLREPKRYIFRGKFALMHYPNHKGNEMPLKAMNYQSGADNKRKRGDNSHELGSTNSRLSRPVKKYCLFSISISFCFIAIDAQA